jgi:predicted flap endonuclease-1-like 5' DNA nuclease
VWFFLAQSLAVLAAAMGLGVLAGWLLFGATASERTSASDEADFETYEGQTYEGQAVEGQAVEGQAVEGQAVEGQAVELSADQLEPSNFEVLGDSDADLVPIDAREDEFAHYLAAEGLDAKVTTSPFLSGSGFETGADTSESGANAAREVTVGEPMEVGAMWGAQPVGAISESIVSTPDASRLVSLTAAELGELEELRGEVDIRKADVTRLKMKLRKAVDEIERRTAQTVAAREGRDAERRRADALQMELLNSAQRTDTNTVSVVDAAHQKTLESLQGDLERAKHRAGQLAIEVEELTKTHARLQSSSQSEREALTVEAASLRLRTDGALEQLNEFGSQVAGFHSVHVEHVARSQKLVSELQVKLAAARSTLAGRSVPPIRTQVSAATVGVGSAQTITKYDNALMQLPGVTKEIADLMTEIGVSSIHEVASWSAHDINRIQEWLPEYPNIITDQRWVERARVIVRTQHDPARLASGS